MRAKRPRAKIEPDRKTLAQWARVLPPKQDQVFLPANFSPADVKGLKLEKILPGKKRHWSLLQRSWYAYTLNAAAYRAILPAGKLERLPAPQKRRLLKIQRRLENPTVLPSRSLPRSLQSKEKFTWATADFFRGLSRKETLSVLAAWARENRLTGIYPKIAVGELPISARRLLRERELEPLVNRFPLTSGPNCFAATAYAISGQGLRQWMHAPPFLALLKKKGFSPMSGRALAGDVLLCCRKGEPVHAAFFLGNGFVFEKSGQDIYEPYRLLRWRGWKKNWAHTSHEVWRKNR